MSAETLRRAATELREEWDDGHNPRGTAWHRERDFHLAVADLLENEANAMDRADGFARDYPSERTHPYNQARRSLLPAVARAYLGEDS